MLQSTDSFLHFTSSLLPLTLFKHLFSLKQEIKDCDADQTDLPVCQES